MTVAVARMVLRSAPSPGRRTCGSAKTSGRLMTRPHGTPAALSRSIHSLGRAGASCASTAALIAARLVTRRSLLAKRGSSRNSAAPSASIEALIGLLLARRDRDLAVLGAEHAVGRDDRVIVAAARRHLAGREIVGGEKGQQADQPVVEAGADASRLAPVRPRRTSAAQTPSAP